MANSSGRQSEARLSPRQQKLHEIIFEADTLAGKAFDVGLFIAIGISVAAVMLESVEPIRKAWGRQLAIVEWTLTILFTIEYVLRLYCVGRPWKYATSFFGVVDLLSIVPTYLGLSIAIDSSKSRSLAVVRILRLLRVFRVLKLGAYVSEAQTLMTMLRRFRAKITVFVFVVMTVVMLMGSSMYLIEGPDHGFHSIPHGVYWAIVTVTTVGYGDISPQTFAGQTIAALAMLIGYAIIVVPASIFSAEVAIATHSAVSTQSCAHCMAEGHDEDAVYCKYCGTQL